MWRTVRPLPARRGGVYRASMRPRGACRPTVPPPMIPTTTPHPTTPPAAMTRRDAARYLGVSVRTLDAIVADGHLPVVRVGRRVLLRRATIDAWLAARERRSE